MFSLSKKQREALELDFRRRRRLRILAEISKRFPDLVSKISEDAALLLINDAIQDGKSLGIVEDNDVIRFASLAFLPQQTRHHPAVASLLIRILNRDAWPASKRLDFIYKNIMPKLRR